MKIQQYHQTYHHWGSAQLKLFCFKLIKYGQTYQQF
jgi:hypothetical protein